VANVLLEEKMRADGQGDQSAQKETGEHLYFDAPLYFYFCVRETALEVVFTQNLS
jgi:hypothetical protein|tara:strand:- start:168 stop:332 length:165 start_codon:yes stop_codon:yes gene_type:complete